MTRTIAVISDLQIPDHDPVALGNVLAFLRDFQPGTLVNVGDDIDSPQTSYWCKGRAGEYAGTLQRDLDETRRVHGLFRDAVGNVPYHVSRSNHGDRTQKYLHQYAPALAGLRCLELPRLLGYDELGITYHREPFPVAPGWVCAHGDEGTLSTIAGRTAGLLAEKWGTSVVCGHTHRTGITSHSYGFGGTVHRTVTGMEVGHLMDQAKAGYLPAGWADWQQAFGLLYVATSGEVTPIIIPIRRGQFTVEGVTYGDWVGAVVQPGGNGMPPRADTANSAATS